MDREGENRIVWAFFVVFVAIIVVSLLFGCKTKTVVETVIEHVHDTVQVHHSDTVKEVKVTHHTDTVKQIETHTFTLNNVGDTVKEIHHYHDLWHTTVIDSTNRYKAVVDSLQKALIEEKSKEKTIIKRYPIPWWLIYFSIAAITTLCAWVLVKGKFKNVDKT